MGPPLQLTQLGFGGWAIDIHKHTLALDHHLVHIRDHATSVAQLVLVLKPVVEELGVALVVLRGT